MTSEITHPASEPTFDAESAVAALEALRESDAWSDEVRLAADLSVVHTRLTSMQSLDPSRVRAWIDRLVTVRDAVAARDSLRFARERASIAQGGLRGADLIEYLAGIEPRRRDLAAEQLLGISVGPLEQTSLADELITYVPSGVAPIVQAVLDASLGPEDVFIDLGSGLGKAVMLAHLLSGARARGVEVQPALAAHADECASRLGLREVTFSVDDARDAELSNGTVFFLYLPFTGSVLARVLERLREVAAQRTILVCALGMELRGCTWLFERESSSFWLSIYESRVPGVPPRKAHRPPALGPRAEAIASER
jgi:hypothetical protein